MPHIRLHVEDPSPGRGGPSALIADAGQPLPGLDDPAFGRLFDRFADARVVLLGAAADGGSEFLRAARAPAPRRG